MLNGKAIPAALALSLSVLAFQPQLGWAQTPPQNKAEDPKALLEDATKQILKAFELFMLTIPQYAPPEVLPNGDIIIRRKNPPQDKAPDGGKMPPAGDGAKT